MAGGAPPDPWTDVARVISHYSSDGATRHRFQDNLNTPRITGGYKQKADHVGKVRAKLEDEIVDASILEDCKVMVALEWQGFTPYEIDRRLGWPKGKSGRLRCDNPRETRRAENLHLEEAQRRYRQAQARVYETLANAILPTVVYLTQVVQGGGENIAEEYRSNLIREVDPKEATASVRIKASEVLLKWSSLLYQESKRGGVEKDDLSPLPESFTGKVEAAATRVGNLRLIGGKGVEQSSGA